MIDFTHLNKEDNNWLRLGKLDPEDYPDYKPVERVDKLEKLFNKQKALQTRFGNIPFENDKDRQEFINLNLLACLDELSEAMRETAWKNPTYIKHGWKKGQRFDHIKFREELVDLWHFVINLTIASGMGPNELTVKFGEKNKENHKRMEDGY